MKMRKLSIKRKRRDRCFCVLDRVFISVSWRACNCIVNVFRILSLRPMLIKYPIGLVSRQGKRLLIEVAAMLILLINR
jgi:hypothetical protein